MVREIIRLFFKKHHISNDGSFLVALSGGADSIALLHAFYTLHLKVTALHCNFNLRGAESDQDQKYVTDYCHALRIPLEIKSFDTISYARKNKISIEMAARDLRYTWFKEMKTRLKADYIVTGHHADDSAETILINLCRGTGIKGMTGIKAVNGDILRPLLHCTREEILQYITEQKLVFRNDSTNDSDDYTRNVIRHKIIPVFRDINPAFLTTMSDNAAVFTEIGKLYDYALSQLRRDVAIECDEEIKIHIAKLLQTPAPATLLFEFLRPLGFNKTQSREVLESASAISGKQFQSRSHRLTKGREFWHIHRLEETRTDILIEKEGVYDIGNGSFKITHLDRPENFTFPKESNIACFDADQLKFPLRIRNWKTGDHFYPLGMKGMKKKISDFFRDAKFSSRQKETTLLLLSGEQIAWIVEKRSDERFKVSAKTRKIVWIEYKIANAQQI